MSTPPFGQENPPQFHSEFGYLCPTPQLRRMFRVAFLCSAIGGIVGAITVWVVMSAGDPDHSRAATLTDTTAAVATTGQGHRLDVAATPAKDDAVTDKAATDCQEQAWPYRSVKCGAQSDEAGTTGKTDPTDTTRRAVRVLRPDQLKQSAPAIVLAAPTSKEAAQDTAQAAASAKEKKESKAKAHKRPKRQHQRARSRDEPDERAYDIPYRRPYQARRWNDDWGWGW
jgi:hypothetical protein